MRCVERLQNV
jgi:hypothetical protein